MRQNRKTKNSKEQAIGQSSGQVMLLAVLLIGTGILVFTSISGHLMIQRIRMASNAIDSTKAVLAADSGIECEFYNYAKSANINCSALNFDDPKTSVLTSTSTDSGGTFYIKSIGASNKTKRAFMMTL
ncbi:hypothetical protein A2999_00410 [Candidatus Wolfebacteria bacterium RIFCSPLOWO2_01_FULL_38_11]|uniref:Type 4 fimbrial biogenesis protein PilX N-terminal domain-containing protein n=2 Tax=Candidatus Wolfeibacteriota TaxID=1752735 RepID=A0A0G0IG74_9BACT|nr:MAG: hypothetical protein US36_C0003G0023 [Candidatus Wolfebacteria bacterium GW2011_GWC1_37_10]OGM90426.1 MAG: hypothetical protein A2999_00410 [Candidatus Wolfebacteria bacterium RIFCSPLOWO2_01_FULL_38_11]